MKQELEKSFAGEIRDRYHQFVARGQNLSQQLISQTNDCRAIGILLKEWSNNQFTFDFFQKHEEVLEMGYKQAKAFISVANRMETEATTIEDARAVWQLDFQAAGLLTIPESFSPQKAHHVTPATKLSNRIGIVREVIHDWINESPVEEWDAETRDNVAGQLEPLVEFYNRVKGA